MDDNMNESISERRKGLERKIIKNGESDRITRMRTED